MMLLSSDHAAEDTGEGSPVATGHLPLAERVQALVEAAYERFKSNDSGRNADYYPALAAVPRHLFGVWLGRTVLSIALAT